MTHIWIPGPMWKLGTSARTSVNPGVLYKDVRSRARRINRNLQVCSLDWAVSNQVESWGANPERLSSNLHKSTVAHTSPITHKNMRTHTQRGEREGGRRRVSCWQATFTASVDCARNLDRLLQEDFREDLFLSVRLACLSSSLQLCL